MSRGSRVYKAAGYSCREVKAAGWLLEYTYAEERAVGYRHEYWRRTLALFLLVLVHCEANSWMDLYLTRWLTLNRTNQTLNGVKLKRKKLVVIDTSNGEASVGA